jgi:hypothetical protein
MRSRLRDDDQVGGSRKRETMLPEDLANEPLNAVPHDGIPDPGADGHA